jgi:serine/threonine protein kinase
MAQTFSPGTRLAGYRLDELVDEGGMGTVFAAEQQYPRRKVAIKLVAGELAEAEEFRERFIRESTLAAAIEHPHILPVYDAGAVDGVLYLAMRYVDGYDLRSLLEREGPLDADRAVFLAAQVGAALDAAHSAGVIHRDVKPANVLIAPGLAGGHREHAYLSDFGIAKRSSSQTLTAPGGYLGTIAYSAPEQIKGEPLDGRADLYSLACLLFECLTGAPPFEGEHDAAVL